MFLAVARLLSALFARLKKRERKREMRERGIRKREDRPEGGG